MKSQRLKFKYLNIKNSLKISRLAAKRTNFKFQIVLIVGILVTGILFSQNPLTGWYHLLKLLEFLFFGFFTARTVYSKKQFVVIAVLLASGIWVESLLALFQYLQQGSLNGLFYFLGERSFTGSTPGIANASLNGVLVLRPYATFPHPNVLAAYLVIAMTFVLSNVLYAKSKFRKLFFFSAVTIGSLALFFTMSRVALVLWIGICLFQLPVFLKRLSKKKQYVVWGVLISGIIAAAVFSPFSSRFTSLASNEESVIFRKQLIDASFEMIKPYPLFGVGLGNFLNNLSLQNPISHTVFFLQPVHNIYLLVLVETGIVGFLFFALFLFKTLRQVIDERAKTKSKKHIAQNWKLVLLTSVIVLGFFDHYFLTLQQGQLLFAFVFGLCWSGQVKKRQ